MQLPRKAWEPLLENYRFKQKGGPLKGLPFNLHIRIAKRGGEPAGERDLHRIGVG